MYKRTLKSSLENKINKGKAIILIGPRQVGKTTLIKAVINTIKHLFLDRDDSTVRNLLNSPNTEQIKSIIGSNKLVFIDEAQRIEGIGLTLKIITDQFKDIQLLVSGSLFLNFRRNFLNRFHQFFIKHSHLQIINPIIFICFSFHS